MVELLCFLAGLLLGSLLVASGYHARGSIDLMQIRQMAKEDLKNDEGIRISLEVCRGSSDEGEGEDWRYN